MVAPGPTFWTRLTPGITVRRTRPLLRILIACHLGLATPIFAQDDTDQGALLADATEPAPKVQGVAYYEELAKKNPEEPQNYQLLAAAYGRQGRVDDARRAARKAIELEPSLAELHQTLGLIEEGADKLPAALEAFKKAASLDGNV